MTEAEDGIVATDDFIAVIDGSTSKSPKRISPDITNGRLCMLLITEFIRQTGKDITLKDFCLSVTEHIKEHYKHSAIHHLAQHPEERLTASCAIYSNHRQEVWMIGDCLCMIENELFDNPKPDEERIAMARAEIATRLIESGKESVDSLRHNDKARQAILPELISSMKGQNKTYSVVDGFPIPIDKVRKICLQEKPSQIVLATDGYPHLHTTLAQTENALYKQQSEDPLNIGIFKATKGFMAGNNSFDDRAYIRFIP